MVTSNSKLGWKHGKASKPGGVYSFSTGGPSLQSVLTFLVARILADGMGCWGTICSPYTDLHLPGGFCGGWRVAAHTLGSLKGFSVANRHLKGKGGKWGRRLLRMKWWSGRGEVWILILFIFSVTLANDFISVLLQKEGIMQMVRWNLETMKCCRVLNICHLGCDFPLLFLGQLLFMGVSGSEENSTLML